MDGPTRSVTEQIWSKLISRREFHGTENLLMTTFNSSEQTKAWCHTQCPKVALPRGSRSSLQRSERSRETCTERESSSPHGQWCSRNFEVHGRLFCVLTGDCTGRSKSPEIFFFQHVKTGHFGVAFTKIVPSNAHWTEERRECQ